ncbi:MAG: hypothetical protein OMOMHJEC_03282 [Xanthomonadales bacterium]|nr:hypothetical protein [Xanthomonadales bacterium]
MHWRAPTAGCRLWLTIRGAMRSEFWKDPQALWCRRTAHWGC